jgi:hypothetical protein
MVVGDGKSLLFPDPLWPRRRRLGEPTEAGAVESSSFVVAGGLVLAGTDDALMGGGLVLPTFCQGMIPWFRTFVVAGALFFGGIVEKVLSARRKDDLKEDRDGLEFVVVVAAITGLARSLKICAAGARLDGRDGMIRMVNWSTGEWSVVAARSRPVDIVDGNAELDIACRRKLLGWLATRDTDAELLVIWLTVLDANAELVKKE